MKDAVSEKQLASQAETQRYVKRIDAQNRADALAGRTETSNQEAYRRAQELGALVENRISDTRKTPAYEQLRQTASMPESSTNKSIIESAKKALQEFETSFANQRRMADGVMNQAAARVGAVSSAGSTSGAISQAEFDKKWPTLKSGQSMVGPNGQTYTKK
jgi:hypothetical protein